VTQTPSATQNRECQDCGTESFADGTNQEQCTDALVCDLDTEYETVPLSPTKNRECALVTVTCQTGAEWRNQNTCEPCNRCDDFGDFGVEFMCINTMDAVCYRKAQIKSEDVQKIQKQAQELWEEECSESVECSLDDFLKTTITFTAPSLSQEIICTIANKIAVECWQLMVVTTPNRRMRRRRLLDNELSSFNVAVIPVPTAMPKDTLTAGRNSTNPENAVHNLQVALQTGEAVPIMAAMIQTNGTFLQINNTNPDCLTLDQCGLCYVGCNNNGQCNPTVNTCSCNLGHVGPTCLEEVDPCLQSGLECQNGATCEVSNQTARCRCPDPYSGDECEISASGSSVLLIALGSAGGVLLLGIVAYVGYRFSRKPRYPDSGGQDPNPAKKVVETST
jgi:hypothetical protein